MTSPQGPTPLTSQTQKPGYVLNNTRPNGSQYTHSEWKATLTEWMASMWAQGGESRAKILEMISPVWYSAKFGEPEPSDQDGLPSPRTTMAFSTFVSQYKGGVAALDQIMPYVPPGPNDFIESPEQLTIRIASENYQKNLDATARAAKIQADEQGRQFDLNLALQKNQDKLKQFNDYYANELSRYGIESTNYNAAEGEKGANLRQAGSLASAFQQLMDSRTNKAIELQANPGDFIQRESQIRAMNAPVGTETPAFKDDETLKKIIDALINYRPGGVAPVVPVQGTPPADDQYGRQIQEQGQGFIVGDPQVPGEPNPESVQVTNPGPDTRVNVRPIPEGMLSGQTRFAFGVEAFDPNTMKLKSYPDEAYQNYPTLKYFQGGMGKTKYDTLATGTATGAFGAQLPESGAINYGKFLNIAKDPISLAMLQSSYKSGSRDLLAEVARAKARAPFGQAVQTSLIRS